MEDSEPNLTNNKASLFLFPSRPLIFFCLVLTGLPRVRSLALRCLRSQV